MLRCRPLDSIAFPPSTQRARVSRQAVLQRRGREIGKRACGTFTFKKGKPRLGLLSVVRLAAWLGGSLSKRDGRRLRRAVRRNVFQGSAVEGFQAFEEVFGGHGKG